DSWHPLVLAAGDLDRLGVQSLMLGGSRSFQSDGVHVTTGASQVVVANDAGDVLRLPDIQLVAKPEIVSTTVSPVDTADPLPVVQTKVGTGQVIIAPRAVLQAIGPADPGGPVTYRFSDPQTPVGSGTSFTSQQIQDYYAAAANSQVAFFRLSTGGLLTTVGGEATYAGLPQSVADVSSTGISNWSALTNTQLQLTTKGSNDYSVGQWVKVTGSSGQILTGLVSAIDGTSVTVDVLNVAGTGAAAHQNRAARYLSDKPHSPLPAPATSPAGAPATSPRP